MTPIVVMSPRVSVLMPVRNAAPWLSESLSSLSAQSERSWELLAVDDGSTDASRLILERWAQRDRRVRVLETVPGKRGIVAALNLGLVAVRAPLLARMDADDVAHAERLACQADRLDARPELSGCCCRVDVFPSRRLRDGMRRYVAWQNSLASSEEIARDRFIECPILHPSIMIRTRTLRTALGGWQDRGWPEDWDLFLRAFERGLAIERIDRALLTWRLHANQSTRSNPRYAQERLCAVRAHYLARTLRAAATHGHGSAQPTGPRAVWILGAGPVGKALAKALAREGVCVAGLADIDPRKIGGTVRSGELRWPVIAMESLLAMVPRPRAVAAVGRDGARDRIRDMLQATCWVEGEDFFVAA